MDSGWHHFCAMKGKCPSKRRGHTATLVSTNPVKILVFGGNSENNTYYNDLYLFLLHKCKWKTLTPTGEPPVPIAYASATLIGTNVWYFGGENNNRVAQNEIFYFDLKTFTWNFPEVKGNKPTARYQHGACGIESLGQIVIGFGCNRLYLCQDMAIFDIGSLSWRIISIDYGPSPRTFGTFSPFPNGDKKILFYGGRNKTNVKGDMWVFDVINCKWQEVKNYTSDQQTSSLPTPKPRAGHTLTTIYRPNGNSNFGKFILFGGWDGTRVDNSETGAENDFWILDLDLVNYEYKWKEVIFPNPPIPRDCHTATHTITYNNYAHQHNNYLIVFGGSDPDFKYIDTTSICNLDGLWEPPKLFLLTLKSILKKYPDIMTQVNSSVLPNDIRDYISTQITFEEVEKLQPAPPVQQTSPMDEYFINLVQFFREHNIDLQIDNAPPHINFQIPQNGNNLHQIHLEFHDFLNLIDQNEENENEEHEEDEGEMEQTSEEINE